MTRKSFKYAFYLNILLIVSVVIFDTVFDSMQRKNEHLPASVTTALVGDIGTEEDLTPSAKSAVLIDAKSGAVLYRKNSSERLPMASTTKIMTALAVLENAELNDIITVTKDSVNLEGTKIYLTEGEKISVGDLLYGLLLESGNDAASALAIGVFGSVKDCCAVMNEIAHGIGLIDTSFENPHGLDSENHYTTAYELALITKKAMENKTFRSIVSTKSYVTSGEIKRYFSNHNRLIKRNDMFTGVKTGYTSKSGRCLVSSTSVGDNEYIAVTLHCRNDWKEHENMHLYAVNNYDTVEIAKRDSFTIFANNKNYSPIEDIYLTTSGERDFVLNYKITIENGIGKVQYSASSTPLGSFTIK